MLEPKRDQTAACEGPGCFGFPVARRGRAESRFSSRGEKQRIPLCPRCLTVVLAHEKNLVCEPLEAA